MKLKSLLKLALLLTVVGGAFYLLVPRTDADRTELAQTLRSFIESVGPAPARLLYVSLYIVGTILLLPGVLLSFIGAVLFGVWQGTLYTWIGATIGATLAFLLARVLGKEFVDQLLGGGLAALDRRLRERGFVGLLVIRLVPLFPFNGVNLGCGLTSLRLRDYVLATAIGIVPGTFVYQYLFATFGEKILHEGFAWSDLATLDVLLPLGAFAAFLLIGGWLARRIR